jgi:hypothetical protein
MGTSITAKFDSPFGRAIDINGNLYVTDLGNDCIRKISPDGIVITVAGNGKHGAIHTIISIGL